MISISGITKDYRMGNNVVQALRGIDLVIEDGDFVAIMGPSGSGKSTLAQILGLLDVPTSGTYTLNGREVSRLTEDDLAALRRKEVGFIFQQFNLLPRMTAFENVLLPLLYSKKDSGEARAQKLLKLVGLSDRFGHKPNELSGGQQQRVAIARSLINQPRIIFADEPTGNLDSISEKEIMAALNDLNGQGITVVMVTHEEEIGAQASRLIRMRDGMIVSDERRKKLCAEKSELVVAAANTEESGFSFSELNEHFRQGFKTLAANKIRTALSMLGILIGVAAVVAMLALGKGAQAAIESQLASLGSNLLVLRPGSVRIGGVAMEAGVVNRLTLDDVEDLKTQLSTVRNVAPSVSVRVQSSNGNRNWSTIVQGTTSSYPAMRASHPEVGRFFTDEENRKRSRLAVIGTTVVRELFGEQNPIGEFIKLDKVSFQVIGVLPEKGANGFRDQDDVILIPVLTAMYRLFGKTYLDSVDIEVRDAASLEITQERILNMISARKHVPVSQRQEAFQIRNMADIQAALSQSNQTMSKLLASIAAISLLVGGIGIMNIMLVSVTERTKEIGLRKAIGAKRQDILLQFLAESVVVSVVGGVAGIALGCLTSVALSVFTGWATSVSLNSVLVSFFFSAFIGIIFGIYPARKASLLAPIEALRYE